MPAVVLLSLKISHPAVYALIIFIVAIINVLRMRSIRKSQKEESGSLARQLLWNPVGIGSMIIVVGAVVAIAFWLFPLQQRNIQYSQKQSKTLTQQTEDFLAVPGTYRAKDQMYLVLNKDGTFEDHNRDTVTQGRYTVNGTGLLMTYQDASGHVRGEKHFEKDPGGIEQVDLPTPMYSIPLYYSKVP